MEGESRGGGAVGIRVDARTGVSCRKRRMRNDFVSDTLPAKGLHEAVAASCASSEERQLL